MLKKYVPLQCIKKVKLKLITMKKTLITTDSEMATVVNTMLVGEKYLNEHNGQIDLDDDDAVAAMMVKTIFN